MNGVFENFPYTNMHDLNLDWIIEQVKALSNNLTEFIKLNTIKYANPIAWNITSQYEANTVVVNSSTGDAYISVQAVPVGVIITNTDYWTQIFNYQERISTLQQQIAAVDEGESTTATASRAVGVLVWVKGKLYRITSAMNAGDAYNSGSGGNCTATTIEAEIKTVSTGLATESAARASADTAEATARTTADNALQNNIDEEETAREDADTDLQSQITTINTKVLPTGGTTGQYLRKHSNSNFDVEWAGFSAPYANILDYGADNTGTNACDTALTNALAAYKTVIFPEGTYKFTTQITMPDGACLLGLNALITSASFGLNTGENNQYGGFNSTNTRIVFKMTNDCIIKGFRFNTDAGCIYINGDDCFVEDCELTTLATITGSTGYYAITVRNAKRCTIRGCYIVMADGNNRDGIHVESQTEKLVIDDCFIVAGDDGIALNSLEGVGAPIKDVMISNCFIGGYGLRLFACGDTPISNVNISNCKIEVTSDNMQSGAIRFSNSTNTVGGTPIGTDGIFTNINISNCQIIGTKASDLSVYYFHAYTDVKFVNCEFTKVIYYDIITQANGVVSNYMNCTLNDGINIPSTTTGLFNIYIINCTSSQIKKYGSSEAHIKVINTKCDDVVITGTGFCDAEFDDCEIYASSITLDASGNSMFKLTDILTQWATTVACGAASYFVNNIWGHNGDAFLTSCGSATRIKGNVLCDNTPTTPQIGDEIIVISGTTATRKLYTGGAWVSYTVA